MQSERTYFRWSLALLGALAIMRLVFGTMFELAEDESYYWVWSQHPDICYYSKGPLVAWVIMLGRWLFGDTVLAIRFFSPLLSLATGLILFQLARRLFDARTAFLSIVVVATVPIFQIGGMLMTIDPLSVNLWMLAALAFWAAAQTGRLMTWAGAGLAIGVGALAKYTNLMELVSFGLALALIREYRRHLRTPGPWVMLILSLLCLVPVLVWNAQHEWVTVRHLIHRGSLHKAPTFQPSQFVAFLGSQAMVMFPLYFAGMIWALCRREWRGAGARANAFRYLLCLIVPLPVAYGALSFNGEWEANWTAPALAMAPVYIAASWGALVANIAWKRVAQVSMILAGIFSLAVYVVIVTPAFYGNERFRRWGGAEDLGRKVADEMREHHSTFLISGSYGQASLLAFYTPGHPAVYLPRAGEVRSQFSFWPGYRTQPAGSNALFVNRGTDEPPPILKQDFKRLQELPPITTVYRGRTMRTYRVFRCSDLRDGVGAATRP